MYILVKGKDFSENRTECALSAQQSIVNDDFCIAPGSRGLLGCNKCP